MQIPAALLEPKANNTSELVTRHFKKNAVAKTGTDLKMRRKRMINAVAAEDPLDAFERYQGENDLLPINYLQIGFLRSRAVGRIAYFDLLERKPVVATGFLISKDLVITNHHVFSNPAEFRDATIEFDYEYDITGKEKPKIVFKLQPEKFFVSEVTLDLAIIAVSQVDITGAHTTAERGYIVLNGNYGKADVNDFASIIQHPDGKPLQVGLRENKITSIDDAVFLKYNTDTTYGSSGAAVFNDQWQLIALHSAGEAKKNAANEYVDKDGNVVPKDANGKVDAGRVVWLNNRGVRISAIMTWLMKNDNLIDNPYIAQLSSPTYNDDKQLSFLSLPHKPTEIEATPLPEAVRVPPVSSPNVYINISFGDKAMPTISSSTIADVAFEKDIEDLVDYSDCTGFDEYFMDEHTPMPKVTETLKRKLAFLVDNPNSYTLKYHHYSTIFHAVRRMPVVSAINISGNKRHTGLSGRVDKWFRDRRIDLDIQLTDDYYAKSGFDRGHMVRREDAEWGASLSYAEKAANMTCAYTNACPQVPALNRYRFGYKGDWGRIETDILEKGVKKETGDQGRICVYNGPIFDHDDEQFKGVQIPMRFFKIVVWRNAADVMKTTSFILSQEKLVDTSEWEELIFDKIFKKFQTSVSHIEKLTGLRFTKVKQWDTFSGNGAGEEERAFTNAEFEKLIKENQ